MERAEFDYGGDVVPEVVVAVLADPQRRACAVFGREQTEAAARTVVSRLADRMGPDVGLDARNRFEWLLRLPQGPGVDAMLVALQAGLSASTVDVDGVRIFVDFAYGISSGSVSGVSVSGVGADRLVQAADAALCLALESQRRMAIAGPEIYERLEGDLDLAVRLTSSSEADFRQFYQPIVRMADGATVGFESLLRWITADGVLLPGDFLTVAEQTSAIVPIGRNGVTQAVRALHESITPMWGPDAFVSINLSRQQLVDETIVDHVVTEIDKYGLGPGQIWIEVQENEVIDFDTEAQRAVERLHESGCTISIDDLGSGFSALRYVRDLPVDVVKVDRALISAIANNPADRAVVHAICEMAETMNVATVAEGVEQLADFTGVEELGFHFAQGIYFGAPRPFGAEQL